MSGRPIKRTLRGGHPQRVFMQQGPRHRGVRHSCGAQPLPSNPQASCADSGYGQVG